MRAVVFNASGGLPTVEEVAEPDCPDDGVIIDVAATGLCRSDWHAWRGHESVPLPHIPGHEFAGTISAVGAAVAGWSVGQRVTVPFVLGCGVCEFCRAGEAQVCPEQQQPGFSLPGSFAQRIAIPRAAGNLVRLPDRLSFVSAAVLGCRFATAFRALSTHGQLRPGQWVAVYGCGGVGLSAIMIAKALGAAVVAVDRSDAALVAAGQCGADVLVESAAPHELADEVVARTGGVHVGIDALGQPDLVLASIRSLRRRGRHIQIGLLHGETAHVSVPMDLVISGELTLLGSHGMPAVDYPAMLELVASGRVDPSLLVTRRISLDEAGVALAEMDQASSPGITVIEPARQPPQLTGS